jgi:hypothetical protein
MSSSERHIKWVRKTAKKLSEEYSLHYEVIENGHLKLRFYDGLGNVCSINLSKTPSCKSTRIVSITKIRRALDATFLIKVDNAFFTLQ